MACQWAAKLECMILATYFDPIIGNGYTLIRTNMGACDFSERNYTYLDEENDFELNSWALATEDVDLKIPMYKKINQIVKNAIPDGSRDIQYYFAPWSAPKWMKTNNDFAGQGKIIEDPKYYKTWAEYFIKFIQAYRAEGLNFQHFSLQNEPLAGMYTSHEWQETGWNATGENEFLINYIIPELIKNGIDDVNVQVMDAQRPFLAERYPYRALDGAETFIPEISGVSVAVHWYTDWVLDKFRTSAYYLTKTYNDLKPIYGDNFYILNTEACMPIYKYPIGRQALDDLGNWFHGERYSEDIIIDLKHHTAGWTDWNIVLDVEGGPNWAENRHDAPIIVDPTTGIYWKNPMFYHMGHFSKFLDSSFTVLDTLENRTNDDNVLLVAAENANNFVIIVLNKNFYSVPVSVEFENGKILNDDIEARSINSFVVRK